MTTEESSTATMSNLQSVQKAMALPTVGAAVGQVGALYTRLKGAHALLDWALSTAESGVALAATTAAPYVASPISFGDAKLAAVIDELEKRVPLVTEEPKVIMESTKNAVLFRLSPHMHKVLDVQATAEQTVKSLKELSWTKANALLSTTCGQKALSNVDSGAMLAMKLLDYYLPPVGAQDLPSYEVVPASSDPALHTVQTVGRLSAVAARRVWANLAHKVNELRNSGIELDVRRYIAALLAALHLAHITNQQHQKETQELEKQSTPNVAEPAESSPSPPENPKENEPTTADQVKTTPEGKSSKGSEEQ